MKNMCDKCRAWKPERTHHCKVCGICVLKMDHHCPWLGNCVGYHNMKAFTSFLMYEVMLGTLYLIALRIRHNNTPEDKSKLEELGFKMSPFGSFCYYCSNFVTMPICLMMVGFNYATLKEIFANRTTIEVAGEGHRESLNEVNYDMSYLNNLEQVLGSLTTFFIPIYNPEMQGKGFWYPSFPDVISKDNGIL